MANLQSMRIQLNFLRDYLFTCREPVIEELQQQINGKNYMYEHVDQYSISVSSNNLPTLGKWGIIETLLKLAIKL